MTEPELTAEMDGVLKRYMDIQRQEQELKDEKARLQAQLADHLERGNLQAWYPEVGGQKLKVRLSTVTVIEYDEPVLRERLGARYASLLAPDLRRIRQHLPELEPLLVPALDRIGSPHPDKVRAAIGQGVVSREDFAGAFQKRTRRIVSVARFRTEESGPESAAAPLRR